MNKNKLLGFFRTNVAIGEITGQFKQNVHITKEYKEPDKVKPLLAALHKRFKELTKDYHSLVQQGNKALEDAKKKKGI